MIYRNKDTGFEFITDSKIVSDTWEIVDEKNESTEELTEKLTEEVTEEVIEDTKVTKAKSKPKK